ncbi:MAG: type IV pilus modification protein PilV [Pseudomonadota bacterium]
MNSPHYPHTSKMAGLTLVEILVTLVILAIGLLGLAALQVVGMRSTGASENRTQATVYLDDLAERLRANSDAIYAAGMYNPAVVLNGAACAAPATYCSDNFNGAAVAGAACSPAQMATFDQTEWYCGVWRDGVARGGFNTLAGASATILCNDADAADAAPCSVRSPLTITLQWTERAVEQGTGGPDTTTQTLTTTIQP